MSSPKRTLTDVRRTETAIYLTIRSPDHDILETVWLGINGNREGFPYELVRISYSLDAPDDEPADVWLTCQDSKGEKRILSFQIEDTRRVLPQLAPIRYNIFTGIGYADDHIRVEFIRVDGVPATFTIGTVGDHHEYTLETLIATVHGDYTGFPLRSYELVDRAGKKLVFQMLVPADKLELFIANQHAYFQALEKQHSPKHEAADSPNVLQQAA